MKPKQMMERIDAVLRNIAVSRGLATSNSTMDEILEALENNSPVTQPQGTDIGEPEPHKSI